MLRNYTGENQELLGVILHFHHIYIGERYKLDVLPQCKLNANGEAVWKMTTKIQENVHALDL